MCLRPHQIIYSTITIRKTVRKAFSGDKAKCVFGNRGFKYRPIQSLLYLRNAFGKLLAARIWILCNGPDHSHGISVVPPAIQS